MLLATPAHYAAPSSHSSSIFPHKRNSLPHLSRSALSVFLSPCPLCLALLSLSPYSTARRTALARLNRASSHYLNSPSNPHGRQPAAQCSIVSRQYRPLYPEVRLLPAPVLACCFCSAASPSSSSDAPPSQLTPYSGPCPTPTTTWRHVSSPQTQTHHPSLPLASLFFPMTATRKPPPLSPAAAAAAAHNTNARRPVAVTRPPPRLLLAV